MTCKVTVAGVEYDAPAEFKARDGRTAKVWEEVKTGPRVFMGVIESNDYEWCFLSWQSDGRVSTRRDNHPADLILPPSVAEQWDEAIKPVWDLFPWARWVCKEKHGRVFVSNEKPSMLHVTGRWHCAHVFEILKRSKLNDIPIPWSESLRKRPEGCDGD